MFTAEVPRAASLEDRPELAMCAPKAVPLEEVLESPTARNRHAVKGLELLVMGVDAGDREILCPRLNNSRVIVECTEWAKITAVAPERLMHSSFGTVGIYLDVQLAGDVPAKLRAMDKCLQYHFMTPEKAKSINWMPLMENDTVQAAVALANTENPTMFHIMTENGTVISGSGGDFFAAHTEGILGCSARLTLELQALEEDTARNSARIVAKIHALFIIRKMTTALLTYSAENLQDMASAAKRIRIDAL